MTTPEPDAVTITRISTLAGADARPALAPEVVKASILAHPMVDRDGMSPEDGSAWTPTWNTYAIVAELWGIKAGKVAGDFDFKADSADYSKGDVMAHCLAMEAKYAAMCAGSTATGVGYYDPLRGVVVNG